MSITSNIAAIREHLPANVKLVCVSKFHPVGMMEEAYRSGERLFGESKVQEMCGKSEVLPKDIEWHFIGHLQTNKIKYIVPFVTLIHGVDSYKLLAEIDKQAAKHERKVNCLLQVHIASEETKFGFSGNELLTMLDAGEWSQLKSVNIAGLMGMATLTDDASLIRDEFRGLKQLFDRAKADYFSSEPAFRELSMGMSDDYMMAVEEGSTMVRIGSSIFGHRNY